MTDNDRDDRRDQGTIHDRMSKDWQTWAICLLGIALTVSWVSSCQSGRAATQASSAARDAARAIDAVRAVEKRDRDSSRATAFRLCSRNTVDRAFAHSRVASVNPQAARLLENPVFLPILDCKPNLRGISAKPLSPKAQRAFVRRWEEGKLTGPQRGICPNTRIGLPVTDTNC